MKIIALLILLCSLLVTGASSAQARRTDDFIFELLPADGTISGQQGEAVGWGYKVTNLSTEKWLLGGSIISISPFLHSQTTSLFGYPIVAPSTTVEVPYNGVQGIVKVEWDADAPIGFTNSGIFEFEGNWYDGDPYDSINPGNFIESAGIREKPYAVTVVKVGAVPEPSFSVLLIAGGLSGFGLLALRRRKRK